MREQRSEFGNFLKGFGIPKPFFYELNINFLGFCMKLTKVEGVLKEFGSSRTVGIWNYYSFAEIGDRLFKKVALLGETSGVFRNSLGERLTLWVDDSNGIVTVRIIQRASGRAYVYGHKKPSKLLLISGLALLPLWGFGLVFLYLYYSNMGVYKHLDNILSGIPNYVSL